MDVVKFKHGDEVWHITDREHENLGVITGILFRKDYVKYWVTWNDGYEEKDHDAFELVVANDGDKFTSGHGDSDVGQKS